MNSFCHKTNLQQHGYSLLEVLVAFVILALAVGTLLSLFATGLRNSAVASDYARALTLAESQLAFYQGISPRHLDSGYAEGKDEGFTWRSRITPYGEVITPGHPARLYRIDVSVDWGEEGRQRSVKLSTLSIGTLP